jgi:NAD+ kinase
MDAIQCVGIISKPDVPQAKALLPELITWLERHKLEYRLDEVSSAYVSREPLVAREDVPDGCQMVIVLGGDGTLLSAARVISGRDIPLFAVNLGGLGFLTAITVDEIFPELERALRGEFRLAMRRMLDCNLERNGRTVARYLALNDVVISSTTLARIIDLDTYVDSQFVCRYKADGLIICTPTGSTAYSLSAGGPIIFPTVGALCITPICPHMLTNRPVLVAESSVIRIQNNASNQSAYLTIDGQVGEPLEQNDLVICRSSEKALHLVRPPKMKFFDVLRSKLKWGER